MRHRTFERVNRFVDFAALEMSHRHRAEFGLDRAIVGAHPLEIAPREVKDERPEEGVVGDV